MADRYQATKLTLFVVIFLSCLTCFSYGYQFVVGGKAGWVPNPSGNYNNWAERMRFQVNDTLLFKYNRAVDSVLVVNRNDYDTCNVSANPNQRFDDGSSTFKFDRSGPFYFITGNQTNCNNGRQKLFIVVMAVRNSNSPPASSTNPAPIPSSMSPSPAPAGESTATPPGAMSPSPAADGPSVDTETGAGGTHAGNTTSPRHSFAGTKYDASFVAVVVVSLVMSVGLFGFF